MTEALDQILLSPGLYWIGELIFVEFLDSDDVFANCELVCKKWQQFFIRANLWKRRLSILQNCKSWKLSEILSCQISRLWTDTDSLTTLEEQNILFRSLGFNSHTS